MPSGARAVNDISRNFTPSAILLDNYGLSVQTVQLRRPRSDRLDDETRGGASGGEDEESCHDNMMTIDIHGI